MAVVACAIVIHSRERHDEMYLFFAMVCNQRRHNHRRARTTTTTTTTTTAMAMAMVTMARVTSTRRLVVTPFARASDGGARSRHATANQNHNENHRPTVSRSNASLAGLTPPPLPSDGGSSYDARASTPTMRPTTTNASGGVYVDYGIFKSKAALKLKAVRPTFETDANGRKIMKRAGGVLLELANAASAGSRSYDWTNKSSFMLSGTEAAELADRLASDGACSFFHDPNAGSANRGSVNKAFKVEPMPDGSGGVFVNLSTTANGTKAFHSVPVSYGESAAIRRVLAFLVPRVLGFDDVFAP